jgi:hypothetical protein
MFNKKMRKITFSFLVLFQIFALNSPVAYAIYSVKIPGSEAGDLGTNMSESFTTGALTTMETRYNLNLASMQDQGQDFNVGKQKYPGPQVMLNFNPASPKPNEEITATATPMYFGNDPKNMYFTWYIKHAQCELSVGKNDWARKNDFSQKITNDKDLKSCDVDEDGMITVNDWKVEAMRKIAGNDFNWKEADAAGKYVRDLDGIFPPNKTQKNKDEDSRGDGYIAYFGGEDQKGLEKEFDFEDLGDAKDIICDLIVLADNPADSIFEDGVEDIIKEEGDKKDNKEIEDEDDDGVPDEEDEDYNEDAHYYDKPSERTKNRRRLFDKLECSNSESEVDIEDPTTEDYAKACIKNRTCIETLDDTLSTSNFRDDTIYNNGNLIGLSDQDWANGCRNSTDACSDHEAPYIDTDNDGIPDSTDGSLGCTAGADNPEEECFTATSNENPPNNIANKLYNPIGITTGLSDIPGTLAYNCKHDGDEVPPYTNNDPYSCATTALLIKNYQSTTYNNLYRNACLSVGEEDCVQATRTACIDKGEYFEESGDTPCSESYAAICAKDSTCPLTALALKLNSTSEGQLALKYACENMENDSCILAATKKKFSEKKLEAFIDLSKKIIQASQDIQEFLEEYPDLADELENFAEAIQKGIKQFQNNLNDILTLDVEQIVKFFLDPENWDDISEFVEKMSNITESITDYIARLLGSKSHCYVHDFATGIDYEIGNRCAFSMHLFPKNNLVNAPDNWPDWLDDTFNRPGNGFYGPREEKFWRTNPEDTSTADNGNVDEANVVGSDKTLSPGSTKPEIKSV